MNRIFLYIFIVFCIVVISAFLTYYFIMFSIKTKKININNDQTFCTLEAKLCPDGSYVGREGPNCEFAECPK